MDYVVTNPRVRPLYRGTQAVWYILNVIEGLLLFRFILRLLGANAAAGFTNFIYTLSYPFVAPFINVFRALRFGNATFEWSTLLAMLVYWLIAWGIVRLIVMNKPITTYEAQTKLNKQDVEV